MTGSKQEKILIIKLGALGDFIQSFGASEAIRRHHPNAHITLLTTRVLEDLARDSGFFDRIHIDVRPGPLDFLGWLDLRMFFNKSGFTRVYDLQNNDRTNFYFRLLSSPKPEWVGIAKGASHRNVNPERTAYHAFDGIKQTLSLAGINDVKVNNLSFVKGDTSGFGVLQPYALIVPGCAPTRPEKRWKPQNYAALANRLAGYGIQPVLIGTKHDVDATGIIAGLCPQAHDLTGQTTLNDVILLARDAEFAVGNDTGPMHMIAPTGCPSLVLFSGASNPIKHCPLGRSVEFIQEKDINMIRPEQVIERLKPRIFKENI